MHRRRLLIAYGSWNDTLAFAIRIYDLKVTRSSHRYQTS